MAQDDAARNEAPELITEHLKGVARGESDSADRLAAAVLDQLRVIARREMSSRNRGPVEALTIEPGMLASDALMKIFDGRPELENRRHFFAYATQVMVRALIDYQRQRTAKKRGGDLVRVTLSGLGSGLGSGQGSGDGSNQDAIDIESLPPVLSQLAELDARKAEVVQLRVFWGKTVPEIAELLDTSPSTIDRDWRFARRWLATQLRSAQPSSASSPAPGDEPK